MRMRNCGGWERTRKGLTNAISIFCATPNHGRVGEYGLASDQKQLCNMPRNSVQYGFHHPATATFQPDFSASPNSVACGSQRCQVSSLASRTRKIPVYEARSSSSASPVNIEVMASSVQYATGWTWVYKTDCARKASKFGICKSGTRCSKA